MGAIPTSDLPGHKQLHDRVCDAIALCQESRDVEFKESAPWQTLRWKITRTALAMGNLRDGGIIIVGLSERGRVWDCDGIRDEHASTFDPDTIIDQVNAYVSPHIDLNVVLVPYEGKSYLTISVREFDDTPLVCKKNGNEGLQEGHVYIRPPGMAKTTKVIDARQMHELLELAAEKRARKLLEMARRIGLAVAEVGPSEDDKFDTELQGL